MIYLVRFDQATSTSIPWEFTFNSVSDRMAVELIEKWLSKDPAAKTCETLLLFNKDRDSLVAQLKLTNAALRFEAADLHIGD